MLGQKGQLVNRLVASFILRAKKPRVVASEDNCATMIAQSPKRRNKSAKAVILRNLKKRRMKTH